MSRQCSCQKRAETNEVHNARPQECVRGHRLLRFVRLDLGFAQAGSTLPALAIESRALLGTEQSCVPHAIAHGLLLGAHSLASDFNVAAHL